MGKLKCELMCSCQLAGGLLSGKYQYDDVEEKKPYGRFFGLGGKWAEA